MKKNLTELEKKQFKYLIQVLSSAVNSTPAPIPYEGISWKNLTDYAYHCSVESLFFNTVLTLPKKYLPSEQACNKFKQLTAKELLIDGNYCYEAERILRIFDKYKIKNIPLKGYFMKKEYTRSDFRSVCDMDILFDRSQIEELKQAFEELGYDFLHYDDNQYHFQKAPLMYVEMHATLVHEDESYFPYLKNQLDNSTKRNGYEYSYQMSPEDYYVYMLVHNSNHFRLCGMGIRMMLDAYVFYRNHKDDFDYDYLNRRLKQLKLDKFEDRVRKITFNWFSQPEPVISFDDMETFILLSGTLGRIDVGTMVSSQKNISNAEKTGRKKTKLSYLLSSVFRPKNEMVIEYRILEKAPFLLPFTWMHMWFKRFFIDKNVHVKRGLKNRIGYSDDDVAHYKKLLDEFGFENFGIRNN